MHTAACALIFMCCGVLQILGYTIVPSDEEVAAEPPFMRLDPAMYTQSNGYLPKPLDLSQVPVTESLHRLANVLAENAHNVWAAKRISQGWTYGCVALCRSDRERVRERSRERSREREREREGTEGGRERVDGGREGGC